MEDLTLTHQQIARSDTTLHYWLAGPTNRPLVVFTHGGTMDHRMFEAQLAPVASNYRVLLWDIHGHGQSQPMGMGGVFSPKTLADDLLAIVDQLGYQHACFIGQSFGGMISQELAYLYPERVSALVVIGSFCLTMPVSPLVRHNAQGNTTNISPSTMDASRITTRPEIEPYIREVRTHITQETLLAMRKAIPTFFHEEEHYRLPMPFLLAHGAQDRLTDIIEQGPIWAKREPNCQYVVIPDAGHNANQDNPAFFNPVLLSFLQQHVP